MLEICIVLAGLRGNSDNDMTVDGKDSEEQI